VTDSGVPALSATQSFWATVNLPVKPTFSAPGMSNGIFSLLISGDAGPDYTVLATTNLALPSAWDTLLTTNSPALPFRFTEPAASNYHQRYYRVLLGP
jgi:hypothetical protein